MNQRNDLHTKYHQFYHIGKLQYIRRFLLKDVRKITKDLCNLKIIRINFSKICPSSYRFLVILVKFLSIIDTGSIKVESFTLEIFIPNSVIYIRLYRAGESKSCFYHSNQSLILIFYLFALFCHHKYRSLKNCPLHNTYLNHW